MNDDTSGSSEFDRVVRERFVPDGCRVKMLTDSHPGKFSIGMTPEQAEFLARHLLALAAQARAVRYDRFPFLYPDDAPTSPDVVVE